MASVLDVAAYIISKAGPMSAMKLQKLVYYGQAWSLVWDDEQLFPEPIQAWKGGPVAQRLYDVHRGQFKVDAIAGGNAGALTKDERETVDAVLAHYGDKSAQWLSDLTHMEDPWINARKRAGVKDGDNCQAEITLADMSEYYSGLQADAD